MKADQAPVYVVHFTQASALERAQSLLSAKLCTREERDEIADAIGAFRFTAGFGKTLSPARPRGHRRPPRRHAPPLPPPRRAARPDRPAEGRGGHGHARRRHQRPDPHRRLHRPRQVRRHQPPHPQGPRVPPDRGPRRPGGLRHVRLRRRPGARSTRSRTRAASPRPATTRPRRSACRRSRPPTAPSSWTEETFERLRNATPESLVSRMRVNHAVILNVINQRGDSDELLRHLIEDSHEDERGKTRLLGQAESLKEELLALRRARTARPARRGRPHARARARPAAGLRAQPAARELRAGRVRPARHRVGDVHARRPERRRSHPRRPVPRPAGAVEDGPRRGHPGDEGRGHRVRGADGAAGGGHLPQAARGGADARARAVPRDAPVGVRRRPLPQVGHARHVRERPDVLRVHRPLRRHPLRGRRAALPERHLPRAAPDRPGPPQDRGARRHRRVARRADPPDRLEPARRVGGADRPGVRPACRRGGRAPARSSPRCARSPPTSARSA